MILVTGGTGFLGKELVRKLQENKKNVRVLSRHPYGSGEVGGDILDKESLKIAMKNADTVMHLAALVDHSASEEELERVNVKGSVNAIEAAIENKAKLFIHCSSVSAEPGGGTSAYGRSKIKAEKELLKYKKKIKIIILRPGPIYDADRKMLHRLLIIPKYLHVFGILWPDTTIHIASRKNVASAFLLALKKGKNGHAYAICDERPVKRSLLSAIICKKTKSILIPIPYPVFYPFLYVFALLCESMGTLGARPLVTRQYLRVLSRKREYDISLARKELGYEPSTTETDFEEAVSKCIK